MRIIKGDIPTLDLSNQTNYQVVVDKEKGSYLGHVSTALLSDKTTIYAVYILGPLTLRVEEGKRRRLSQSLTYSYNNVDFFEYQHNM